MLPFAVLIFLSVTLGLLGIYFWLAPNKTLRRIQSMDGRPGLSGWVEQLARVSGPLAKLSLPEANWDNSLIRIKFLRAGIRFKDARLIFFGAKTAVPLVFATLAYLALRGASIPYQNLLLYVVTTALLGCYVPNVVLHLMMQQRQRELFENFPDAADLMLVCVEAGLGLDAAMNRVAEEIKVKSEALAEELHLANLEMRAGGGRDKALHNLATRCGIDEIGTFVIVLNQADKFGTSVGESLRVFSDDLRHKRRVRAEELAAKIPTKMLFPLVLCVFPSIFMVVLGPALIHVVRTLLPMMGGSSA